MIMLLLFVAVETIDFMTARWAHLPYDFLDVISRRIINEVPGISRVAYDISGKTSCNH
jgi:GMP synthase (glutamine-hydrolysing)